MNLFILRVFENEKITLIFFSYNCMQIKFFLVSRTDCKKSTCTKLFLNGKKIVRVLLRIILLSAGLEILNRDLREHSS